MRVTAMDPKFVQLVMRDTNLMRKANAFETFANQVSSKTLKANALSVDVSMVKDKQVSKHYPEKANNVVDFAIWASKKTTRVLAQLQRISKNIVTTLIWKQKNFSSKSISTRPPVLTTNRFKNAFLDG